MDKLKWILLSTITIIMLILSYGIFGGYDFLQVICWYGLLLLMTITGLPLTMYLFRNFRDSGYIFSKILGIIFSGFLMWFLSSIHLLKFNTLNSYLCIFILLFISYFLFIFRMKKEPKKYGEIIKDIKKKIPSMIKIELLFLIVFLIVSYVKGFHPEITNSTEQYMDYGFMKIMDKTDYMPPIDIWFSGKFINYYYFGQYISTFLTKVSQVGVNYGYNLMLVTLFTITLFIGYSICFNLLSISKKNKDKKNIFAHIGGLIGASAITIAGNMHYVLYGIVLTGLQKYFSISLTHSYYYPDSTRYIGYTPDVNDKTIHEFPSYSFTIGDLHAHVINIIFVLTVVGLLLAFLLNRKEKNKDKVQNSFSLKEVFNPIILIIGFLIGIFKMTNYWDYPIYFVVTGAVVLFSNILTYSNKKDIFKLTFLQAILILIISSLVSLPFTLNFTKMASQIKLAKHHTPLFQLLVLWGLPTIMVIYYIFTLIKKSKLKLKSEKEKIRKVLSMFELSDLFIVTIGLCAIGLVLVPEFVYVRDIYEYGYARANTMFKVTYQAYLLFGICFGYVLIKLLCDKDKKIRKKGIIFTVLFILTLGYTNTCIDSWFGNVFNADNYKTLDGAERLSNGYNSDGVSTMDDNNVINWLNENADKDAVILEAYGDSYTYSNTISVFTGLATPLGWTTHEHLWRSKNSSIEFPKEAQLRINDIDLIYNSNDEETVKALLEKYNISYIIIGYNERNKYGIDTISTLENEEILKDLGEVVYSSNVNGSLNATYIIKIK